MAWGIIFSVSSKENRNVPTADELKKEYEYALIHKHFKGIPSEKEVVEKGVSVNEIIEKQMRLIEKLYRYIYLLNEEVKILKETKD